MATARLLLISPVATARGTIHLLLCSSAWKRLQPRSSVQTWLKPHWSHHSWSVLTPAPGMEGSECRANIDLHHGFPGWPRL